MRDTVSNNPIRSYNERDRVFSVSKKTRTRNGIRRYEMRDGYTKIHTQLLFQLKDRSIFYELHCCPTRGINGKSTEDGG